MLNTRGGIGVGISITAFLLLGWIICRLAPSLAKCLIAGSPIVALTQVFPILHLIAGLLGFLAAVALGLATDGDPMDGAGPQIDTILGGFLISTVTGCLLSIMAFFFGWIAVIVFRWLLSGRSAPSVS